MTKEAPPVDHEAREATRHKLGTSFVLEAGAGTGKTTLIIDRIEALVRTGRARLEEIAAVTFTENAATTMKLRLRERLERARLDTAAGEAERERAAAALDVIERAQISTIHALCAAILQERPLECGVTPGFRMGDEADADRLFADAWEDWLATRLVGEDALLVEALDLGIALEPVGPQHERGTLKGLARTLIEQRDLEPLVTEDTVDAPRWREQLLAKAARAGELIADVKVGDALGARLQMLIGFGERSRPLSGIDLASYLVRMDGIPKNFGFRPHWPSSEALEEAKRIGEWTKSAPIEWQQAWGASLHGRLVRALGGVVALYEEKKAADGMLDFLDLLLLARNALRDHESVRRALRHRFRLLLIDEFQDTDPLQVEIARFLAGDAPGALVVVGDAKQSIYRFRRAEVRLFEKVAEEARQREGHEVLKLTQNFRSRPAILRFVNRVFAELIVGNPETGQPAYQPIAPLPGLVDEPSVLALRFDPGFEQDALLPMEAAALATWIALAAKGRVIVRDPVSGKERASRAGDVMVLVRRLTQLRHLEAALEAADLRYTVDGGKSFFDRHEVRETLAALRAIDDPSNRVARVAALRSSLFGASDRDIAVYVLAGGSLTGDADASRPGGAVIAPALSVIEALHRERTRISVPALLERLYDETRLFAAVFGTPRGDAQIANLEKVVALARQAGADRALTLRGFCNVLVDRIENAREEPDLPVTRPGDPDTIRILSIHKAKGLEAPIVVLHDTADSGFTGIDVVPLWEEGRVAIGFKKGCQPPGWDALTQREQGRARAEQKRLLYVACTRARDYLVIPRPSSAAPIGDFWRDLLDRLPTASDADVRVVDEETLGLPEGGKRRIDLRAIASADGPDPVAERWHKQRAELLAGAASQPLTPISATRAAAREAPPPVSEPSGETGRHFGALVHRILEWIPLDAPERAGPMAAALAPAFGLDSAAAERAAKAVAGALGLPVLDRARRATGCWRELRVWLPQDGELIEGIVDLVFEEDGALVVVDYKTDRITAEQAIAQAGHHAPQLQLYGRALAQATDQKIKERLVLFTSLPQTVQV